MAPGSSERAAGGAGGSNGSSGAGPHTGTIPKGKVRNNSVVPQEAVTPTRRDTLHAHPLHALHPHHNLAATSLDWVPVSEYNTRTNYGQSSRKTTNHNTADHDYSDLDNSITFENSVGRFVPVRPQPRVLPLSMQHREGMTEPADDSAVSGPHLYNHNQYPQPANGVSPHASHATAAVMIVNPTTPNTVPGHMPQPFNVPGNTNRNNLNRAFHTTRNGNDGPANGNTLHINNNAVPSATNGRAGTKTNNLMNNVYEPGQSSTLHNSEATHSGGDGESVRAMGEALVSACPDAASVERRLGQIREYIRVTSSLVDTMRNSEDEAYIEHTKEEYDELIEMVMKLKESETKLVKILHGTPDNNEVLTEDEETSTPIEQRRPSSANPFVEESDTQVVLDDNDLRITSPDKQSENESVIEAYTDREQLEDIINNNNEVHLTNNNLVKKVTNVENEQLNKSNDKLNIADAIIGLEDITKVAEKLLNEPVQENNSKLDAQVSPQISVKVENKNNDNLDVEITEAIPSENSIVKSDEDLNDLLRKNIISCNEKLAVIEELKSTNKDAELHNVKEGGDRSGERAMRFCKFLDRLALSGALEACNLTNNLPHVPTNYQEMSVRPMSVQSNGSAYSDSDLWQSELKAKMEVSQQRLAALQEQQKRLLKYQAEAKHQLAEMHNINRNRQSQENLPQDNHQAHAAQNQLFQPNHHQAGRIYNPNQIGVATTLPHTVDSVHHQNTGQLHVSSGSLQETYHTVSSHCMELSGPSAHGHHQVLQQEDRYPSRSANMVPEESQGRVGMGAGAETGGEGSEEEEQELLNEHGRVLQHKLRDLQLKKQHMEQLVADFQKLQAAERGVCGAALNTYSSSPDDSGAEDENIHHGIKAETNIKNEDPFKLMEISAIKAALQKTKDLMRRAERYRPQESVGMHEDSFPMPSHSNLNDNKSEGGGSAGGWSNDSSLCRVRNSIQHKVTNHTPQHSATAAIQEQEASISSLQMLAQQLRQEAQSIADERKRLKHALSKKDGGSKLSQKKVNAELGGGGAAGGSAGGGRRSRGEGQGSPGPVERKQIELQAELAEKQRQLEMILHKEKDLCGGSVQKANADSCTYSAMNQSYNSDQEEGDSRTDDVMFPAHSQHQPDSHHYRSADGSVYGDMIAATLPPHLTNIYCSDSDSGTRSKSGQRAARQRRSRPPPLEHQPEDPPGAHGHSRSGSAEGSVHAEPRTEPPAVPVLPPHLLHPGEGVNSNTPYPHMPPPTWSTIKSNQDVRTNQFTQNSHSQTMERLLGAHPVAFPPSMPFNMMMPYGMLGGGACGCSWWGPWCWQQLASQQREIQQLRDQLNNLEERWRAEAEAAPHALNNQVPPGNRANNYWDNFRSYSRQNLLSANSKTNADGHLGTVQPHNPHPLVERSHNTFHPSAVPGPAPCTPPINTPKRNTNSASALLYNPVHPQAVGSDEPTARHGRRNIGYDTSHTFPTTPDVLNINQHTETDCNAISSSRIVEETIAPMNCVSNVNINRDDPLTERNLNVTNPIPEIIQSHSNNLNSTNSFNNKKKSSSKLPAKNSSNRRNYSLDFVQNTNMDTASTSELPNLNLASSSRDPHDKSTSKLFDLLRENVYSEVTALISANESHPDFLIQLFRDLQQISSDSLRQHALQSIRDVLSQFSSGEGETGMTPAETRSSEAAVSTTNYEHQNTVEEISITNVQNTANSRDRAALVDRDIINFMLAKSEETCTPELLETMKSLIIGAVLDAGHSMLYSQKRLKEFLSKYEGSRLRDVSGDIIDNLVSLASVGSEQEEITRQTSDESESSILQDVAGSLNIFSHSDSHLHQINLNVCSYDPWASGLISGEGSNRQLEGRFNQEAKVDLIDSVEMYNGDLAEADQTCHSEAGEPAGGRALDECLAEMLPDVVEAEEGTPTEAEAEWLGLDRVPTRLHIDDVPANQKD